MKWGWRRRGENHPDPVPSTRTEQVARVAEQVEAIARNQKIEAAELLRLVHRLRADE